MQKTLVQEKVPFEVLCPDWNGELETLEKTIDLKGKQFSVPCREGSEGNTREHCITNGASCIVGEAHA